MTPDLLLIGHVTADLTPEGRVLGGTVSYAARIAHSFGLSVAIVTSAAPHEPLLDSLAAVADLTVVPAEETTTFENRYTGAHRHQTLHGCARALEAAHIPPAWCGAPLVHLAPVADELSADVFGAFRGRVMLTPQGMMRQWGSDRRVRFRPWFRPDLLRHVHLVVFSEQDVEGDAALKAQYAAAVTTVVTDGAAGGTAFVKGRAQHYAPYPAHEADPTGAGDVFAVSLMIGLYHRRLAFAQALALAARLAALTVEHPGVYTPTPTEVDIITAHY